MHLFPAFMKKTVHACIFKYIYLYGIKVDENMTVFIFSNIITILGGGGKNGFSARILSCPPLKVSLEPIQNDDVFRFTQKWGFTSLQWLWLIYIRK